MPRSNPTRSLAEEDNLARRIAYERDRRGWSNEGLAQRMTQAGCPINQSALYKIEHASPRRRIAVAEMVALSNVFKIPLDDLLKPPEIALNKEIAELIEYWRAASTALDKAVDRIQTIEARLHRLLEGEPETSEALVSYLASQRVTEVDALNFVGFIKRGGSSGQHQATS